jgi:phosphodiesterase/alkaline phosphatase D-like protein
VGTSAATYTALPVANKTATLNGLATTGGAAVNSWFEYGIDGQPGVSTTPKVAIPATLATKPMTAALSALKPHTTYWFRLAVDTGTNKFVGEVKTFLTGNAPPVASVGSISIKEDTVTTLR